MHRTLTGLLCNRTIMVEVSCVHQGRGIGLVLATWQVRIHTGPCSGLQPSQSVGCSQDAAWVTWHRMVVATVACVWARTLALLYPLPCGSRILFKVWNFKREIIFLPPPPSILILLIKSKTCKYKQSRLRSSFPLRADPKEASICTQHTHSRRALS